MKHVVRSYYSISELVPGATTLQKHFLCKIEQINNNNLQKGNYFFRLIQRTKLILWQLHPQQILLDGT